MVKVHYIFDPMCGWCYGATSLINQLDQMAGINLQLHPGGMMPATPISADFRQHILAADQRIEAQTGQPFGEAYRKKVASGEALILDSYITAQAIAAVETLGHNPVAMLKKIQQAHYQLGLPVNQPEVLAELAGELGIAAEEWRDAMQAAAASVDANIQQTRELMERFGLGGFPSMVVEKDGAFSTVTVSQFYRQPEQWQAFWDQLLSTSVAQA